jgi:hypothetical protein
VTTRESLHDLLDELPESVLGEVESALRRFAPGERSALRAFLETAPLDDEPLTDEDIRAIDEARKDLRTGRLVPHSKVMEMVPPWPKD